MPKAVLTDISVRALKAPARGQITVWDSSSPVGVRISAGGTKTFIVLVGSGKRQTIGKFGIITLAEARAEAKRILAEKTLGIAKPKPSGISFEIACNQFLEENYKSKRPRTKAEAKRLLERHFTSAFGKRPISEITDTDVGTVLSKLAKTPSEQLHAFRAIRTMLKWCTRPPRRYIPHSPLEGYEPPGEDRKGTRVLSDAELAKIWKAATGRYGGLFRLLILWGTRNGETARIQRLWVEDNVLTIPGEVTKNKRAHAIPLLPLAKKVLSRQPEGAFLFPGKSPDTFLNDGSWGKLKADLDRVSGVHNWQLRDIRRTFRSNLAKLKVPREIAEIMLNHVTGANRNDLDEIYDRYDYLDEKVKALAKWESRLRQILKKKQ
ncbi:MAG: site-specific integrase [Xanthobacteraceae bacterium]|nr:site-specific integrase [Xanthobacteraceae bacterium]